MKLALALLLLPPLALAQTGQIGGRPHQPPTLKLLAPGAAPRASLRYALKDPQELTIVVRGEWTVSAPVGSAQNAFPTVTTPVRLTPAKAEVGYLWLKPSFVGPPPGSRLEAMTAQLITGLDGSSGSFVPDPQGVIARFVLHPGPNDSALDAGSLQRRSVYAMEMGKGMLALLDLPLPPEPIGLGGRWQVERIAVRGPLSFIQVTTYTLERRVGDLLEVSYRFGGKWDAGSGFLESEMKLAVSGGGKATVNLALPLPVALEDEIDVSAQLTGKDGQRGLQRGLVGTRVESK